MHDYLYFTDPDTNVTYTRHFSPPSRLIILGGGYVAQSLSRFASALEFKITVADDRGSFANTHIFPDAEEIICDSFTHALEKVQVQPADYVVIVTRGHTHDAECLRVLLTKDMPDYVGMIGSRRRVAGLFHMLETEGFSREKMDAVHTPIGLSIGAVTPDEIAVSILAELISCRSGNRACRPSSMLEQTNTDPVFIRCLDSDVEKAVAVVIERSGSTPVKSGAVMAITRDGQTYGTVGGGCGEHEILLAALRVLRSGVDECITVNMCNDIAEEEGMVCGGQMKVIIEKWPDA